MLQQVVLVGPPYIEFDLEDTNPNDRIILKSLSGLTPGDITLFTGQFARDGGYYRGRRVGSRNPVFTFKLNPDYKNDVSVSDLRENLYSWFLGSAARTNDIRVILKDDRMPDREMTVFAEKFETDLFSKTTEIMISTLCLDPYLKSIEATTLSYNATSVSQVSIDYPGTAAAGLSLVLKVKTACNNIGLNMVGPGGGYNATIYSDVPFQPNDTILYTSVPGSRSLIVNGQNRVNFLIGDHSWLELAQGINSLSAVTSPSSSVEIVTVVYTALWWGV